MRSRVGAVLTAVVAVGLFCVHGSAQVLIDTIVRPLPAPSSSAPTNGQCLVSVGDQDGDGIVDFAATEPLPPSGFPEITIFSGSTRLPIQVIPMPTTANFGGIQTLQTGGDFNGDGRDDLLVRFSPQSSASARIFDPLSGSQLWANTAGGTMTPIEDATGDGRMDIATASTIITSCSGGGFWGPTGTGGSSTFNVSSVLPNPPETVLYQAVSSVCVPGSSSGPPFTIGTAFRGIRDMNGDGRTDFFIAPAQTPGIFPFLPPQGPPALKVFTSSVSATGVTSYVETASFNVTQVIDIIAVSDMTGDGQVDACVVNVISGGFGLTFYSSQSTTVFQSVTFATPTYSFPKVMGVGDVDKDGVGDFAVEYDLASTARVAVYSGATVTVLFDIVPPGAPLTISGSSSIAWLGDTDGDGSEELAIARNSTREIFIYSLRHTGVTYFGQGCGPTTAPEIGIGGNLLPNGTIRYNFSNTVPFSLGILMLGVSNQFWGSTPLPFDLAPIGLPGCDLLVSPDLFEFVDANAIGAGGFSYPLPAAGIITGFTLYGQWFFEHPFGSATNFGVSNGVEVVFP